MKLLYSRVAVLSAASLFAMGFASPADAAGCNGVVNPAIWGCAPWDNNNGPNYPYYKKKAAPSPIAKGATSTPGSGVSPNAPGRNGGSLIGNDGGSLIGNDGAGIKPPG